MLGLRFTESDALSVLQCKDRSRQESYAEEYDPHSLHIVHRVDEIRGAGIYGNCCDKGLDPVALRYLCIIFLLGSFWRPEERELPSCDGAYRGQSEVHRKAVHSEYVREYSLHVDFSVKELDVEKREERTEGKGDAEYPYRHRLVHVEYRDLEDQ